MSPPIRPIGPGEWETVGSIHAPADSGWETVGSIPAPFASDATRQRDIKGNWITAPGAARVAEDQLTFGLGPKLNAAMRALFTSESYQSASKDEKAKLKAAWEARGALPAAVVGNLPFLLKGALTKGPKAVATVAKELTTFRKVMTAAGAGAKFGAAQGIGSAEWDAAGQDLFERLNAAVEGGVKGAAFGAAAGGVFGTLGVAPGAIKRGSQNISARAAAATAAGVPLTVGQKLNNVFVKGMETAVAVLPTGRGVMGRFGEEQALAVKANAEKVAERMAGGAVPSIEEAGLAGIAEAKRIGERFEATRAPLADEFRQVVNTKFPANATGAMTNAEALAAAQGDAAAQATLRAEMRAALAQGQTMEQWAASPIARVNPTPTIDLPEVRTLADRLRAQSEKASFETEIRPVLADAEKIIADADAGVLDAADLLRLRTRLGAKANFSSPSEAPDPSQTYIKDLWRAVSGDVKGVAKAAGPDAEKALAAHDALVTTFRRTSATNPAGADFWAAVERAKTPQDAYRLLTTTPNNAQAARAIRAQMEPKVYDALAARRFLEMGRANATIQGVTEEIFSPEHLVSRWNEKGLTPEVKAVMFGTNGKLPEDMMGLLKTAKEIQSSSFYRNLSGTAGMLQGTQAFRDIANAAISATGAGGAGGLVTGAVSPIGTAVGLATPYLGAHAMTSGLANKGIDLTANLLRRIPSSVANTSERIGNAAARVSGNMGPENTGTTVQQGITDGLSLWNRLGGQ